MATLVIGVERRDYDYEDLRVLKKQAEAVMPEGVKVLIVPGCTGLAVVT